MNSETILITNAKYGGYVVTQDMRNPGFAPEFHFAGTLDACLEYIRDKLYNAELARNREAVL